MDLESYYQKLASVQKKNVLLLTDRGVMDNTAYCSEEVEQKVFDSAGWNKTELRDKRYDMVIHLVTAADGAREFYTLSNNAARTESPELAIKLDKMTQEAWNGHPYYS